MTEGRSLQRPPDEINTREIQSRVAAALRGVLKSISRDRHVTINLTVNINQAMGGGASVNVRT